MITLIALLLALTSMSECERDGPETIVNGTVTDVKTGAIYARVPLEITKISPGFKSSRYSVFDTILTPRGDQYHYRFIPKLPADYEIGLANSTRLKKINLSDAQEGYSYGTKLILGSTNTIDFKVHKLVNLTVNLKNKMKDGYNRFSLTARPNYYVEYFVDSTKISKDTTLHFKVPRFFNLRLSSVYFGAKQPDFKSVTEIYVSGNDTTININN